MPTRKQRRREAKSKRHEYEFVYVDDEGQEVEPPPESEEKDAPKSRNGSKPASKTTATPRRTTRGRVPPQPSWQRAGKRAALLGVVVFILFSFASKGSNRYYTALVPAVIYTVLFIPFTYAIDRFAYQRWQRREQSGATKKK